MAVNPDPRPEPGHYRLDPPRRPAPHVAQDVDVAEIERENALMVEALEAHERGELLPRF